MVRVRVRVWVWVILKKLISEKNVYDKFLNYMVRNRYIYGTFFVGLVRVWVRVQVKMRFRRYTMFGVWLGFPKD